ncbi:uncharacterized protein BDR25DRAFT_277819 [Lindgomyces ingoldianus]|uniref:Uncharacterized protein n=1 Tax=Lindgomyces ingoldianus TaxID=673940 RepID=A0ACB6RBP8_9PLEO|nr:uncharacterized protein BDR25DRAFT_277819 [Lindgomyces ingoldianus]KAF2476576.1 hypothetical protein BDR25DRAFT_277819 [Lindgomyces ingoldianus]
MGQSVTRLPDLPIRESKAPRSQRAANSAPRQRRPNSNIDATRVPLKSILRSSSPQSRNRRRSLSNIDATRNPLKSTVRSSSPQSRAQRRSRALSEIDSNYRQAAASAWTRHYHGHHHHGNHHDREWKARSARDPGRPSHRYRDRSPEIYREDRVDRSTTDRKAKQRASYLNPESPSAHTASTKKSRPKSGITVSEGIELEDLGPKNDCMVCAESLPLRRFPKRPPTAQCTHEINTCKRCLRNWIRSEFQSKVWDQINCPECRIRMDYEDIRQFAPSEVFRRYDRLSTKAALEAIPGFRWCPGKGCRSGQVHDENNLTPKFKCVDCRVEYCVVHNRRWHKGETCAEYDYRTDGRIKKAEEEASRKWIKTTAKKCPSCKYNIEKLYGCDHMTCTKCRHEFCWVCLAPYDPIRNQGNRHHRPNCSHYG